MDYNKLVGKDDVSFEGIPPGPFLLGLLSAFENRFQAFADGYMKEITWKQFFAIICINMCREAPTLNKLSEIMGSSHQNVKQILLKLEKKGFIQFVEDASDKRKQRIRLTEQCLAFCEANEEGSRFLLGKLFEGIAPNKLSATIQVISQMEKNLQNF